MRALLVIVASLSAQGAVAGVHSVANSDANHFTASGGGSPAGMNLIIKNNMGPSDGRNAIVRGMEKTVTSVPEPDTAALLSTGLAGMLLLGWRRRNARSHGS